MMIADGLRDIQNLFDKLPCGIHATWHIDRSDFTLLDMYLNFSAGTLLPDHSARIEIHHGHFASGSQEDSQPAFLEGPAADFTNYPWNIALLHETLDSLKKFQPALTILHRSAEPFGVRFGKIHQYRFPVGDANLPMLADFFDFDEQLALAESIILAESTHLSSPPQRSRKNHL